MKTEDVIIRVLALLNRSWVDLVIAVLTEKYGDDYWDLFVLDNPTVKDSSFFMTNKYIMELIGVQEEEFNKGAE